MFRNSERNRSRYGETIKTHEKKTYQVIDSNGDVWTDGSMGLGNPAKYSMEIGGQKEQEAYCLQPKSLNVSFLPLPLLFFQTETFPAWQNQLVPDDLLPFGIQTFPPGASRNSGFLPYQLSPVWVVSASVRKIRKNQPHCLWMIPAFPAILLVSKSLSVPSCPVSAFPKGKSQTAKRPDLLWNPPNSVCLQRTLFASLPATRSRPVGILSATIAVVWTLASGSRLGCLHTADAPKGQEQCQESGTKSCHHRSLHVSSVSFLSRYTSGIIARTQPATGSTPIPLWTGVPLPCCLLFLPHKAPVFRSRSGGEY